MVTGTLQAIATNDTVAPSAFRRGRNLTGCRALAHRSLAWRDTDRVFFALLLRDSAVIEGVYLPRTNDSLYHARRILDAASAAAASISSTNVCTLPTARGFRGRGVRLSASEAHAIGVVVRPNSRPSRVHRLRAGRVDLGQRSVIHGGHRRHRAVSRIPPARDGVLCTVAAHSAAPRGRHVDHHYVEHTFVLATFGSACFGSNVQTATAGGRLGRHWASQRVSQRAVHIAARAARLPCSCSGCAMQHRRSPRLRGFAAALLVTTQLILLPSEPFGGPDVRVRTAVLVSFLRRSVYERLR